MGNSTLINEILLTVEQMKLLLFILLKLTQLIIFPKLILATPHGEI